LNETGHDMDEYVLETRGLCKEFLGFRAVSNVDLRVRKGSIHALIGPNGAGKTSVFNLLTKFLSPTQGTILLDGTDITSLRAADVAGRGMVRSFQISSVFPEMTALGNVMIGLQRREGLSPCFWRGSAATRHLREEAMELLAQVGLANMAGAFANELSYGRRRSLELATTLGMNPRVLLLDEPTQGMGVEDVSVVTALVERIARSRTVMLVEHNLKVVSTLADRVTVLARGSVLAEGSYSEVASDPNVVEAYIGVSHG
jgi:branched-chain amino acid transport system ATP-binding protein